MTFFLNDASNFYENILELKFTRDLPLLELVSIYRISCREDVLSFRQQERAVQRCEDAILENAPNFSMAELFVEEHLSGHRPFLCECNIAGAIKSRARGLCLANGHGRIKAGEKREETTKKQTGWTRRRMPIRLDGPESSYNVHKFSDSDINRHVRKFI